MGIFLLLLKYIQIPEKSVMCSVYNVWLLYIEMRNIPQLNGLQLFIVKYQFNAFIFNCFVNNIFRHFDEPN